MNAYERGKWDCQAYNYENPYEKGTPEFDQWTKGYSDQEDEDFSDE